MGEELSRLPCSIAHRADIKNALVGTRSIKTRKLSQLVNRIHAASARDSLAMVRLYQQYLTLLLDATQATWMAAYKGPFGREAWQTRLMDGWRAFDRIYPEGVNAELSKEAKAYFKQAQEAGDVDPQVSYAISKAGATRVQRLHEAISPEDWSTHWMSGVLASKGVGERMVGAYTLSDIAESYILVDRPTGARPFSQQDADTLYQALSEFPRLHQWLFLERGLIQPAQRPLTPRQQEVLHLLLGSGMEADFSAVLGLSKGTVHNYVTEIYKNFAVQSRFELVQLWLKRVEAL